MCDELIVAFVEKAGLNLKPIRADVIPRLKLQPIHINYQLLIAKTLQLEYEYNSHMDGYITRKERNRIRDEAQHFMMSEPLTMFKEEAAMETPTEGGSP